MKTRLNKQTGEQLIQLSWNEKINRYEFPQNHLFMEWVSVDEIDASMVSHFTMDYINRQIRVFNNDLKHEKENKKSVFDWTLREKVLSSAVFL